MEAASKWGRIERMSKSKPSIVRWLALLLVIAAVAGLAISRTETVHANDIAPFQTIYGTDYTSAGYGGMRGIGTGTVHLTGVSGGVTKALLFWHGPTNSTDPAANASVTFAGTPIVGTNIGFSASNCWDFTNSQAYRADVTSLVHGNGDYSLANFTKPDADINGVSLMVFFNDGNAANNRDIVIFDGNDSNTANPYDAAGWNVSLPGINYTSGSASLELHVSDGQVFPDDGLILNGQTLAAAGSIFQGDSVPNGPAAAQYSGGLWDIKSWDVTSYLTPGPNTLTLTTDNSGSDCLSLIAAVVNLPAGAAPNQPSPAAPVLVRSATPTSSPTAPATDTPVSATSTPIPTNTSAPPPPPQPTATSPGGGTAGVITGPNTGSGPGGSGVPWAIIALAAMLVAGGAALSTAALRARRR